MRITVAQGFSPAKSVSRKLVPCVIGPTPKLSAIVWPRSANVVPRAQIDARLHAGPVTSNGTCSREWSVLGVVGSLP